MVSGRGEPCTAGASSRSPAPPATGGMPRSARRISACRTSSSFPMARASSRAFTSMSRAWAFLASALDGVAYFRRSSAFTISSKISFASIPRL
jgi:hypothetical protein